MELRFDVAFAGRLADQNVTGQGKAGGCQRFGGDRAQVRIIGARNFLAAGGHFDDAAGVISVLGVQAADHRKMVHLASRMWQQLANMSPRDGRRNRTERATRVGIGLGVPRFQLAHTTVQEDVAHLFVARLELFRDRAGGEQLTHPGCTQNRRSQKGAAMHVMFGGPAGVGVLHGNPSDS